MKHLMEVASAAANAIHVGKKRTVIIRNTIGMPGLLVLVRPAKYFGVEHYIGSDNTKLCFTAHLEL